MILNWLKDNLVLVLYIVTAVTYIFIYLIKAIKSHKIKNFKDLMEFITFAINDAEELKLTGNQKFFYVMKEIQSLCKQLCLNFDSEYFSELVEDILSTPQKKGGNK